MLERAPYQDYPDQSSTITSVVRRPGNPQTVVVTEVDTKEFLNQGNDGQPSLVDPRWGINNTQPAILTPDPMWSHRWPDTGPYRGMTAKPFSWESAQEDGLGELTQAQRDRHVALVARADELTAAIGTARQQARGTSAIDRLALIEGQLERARTLLASSNSMQDDEHLMAIDEVAFELDQVAERLAAGPGTSSSSVSSTKTGFFIAGGIALLAAGFWFTKKRSGSLMAVPKPASTFIDRYGDYAISPSESTKHKAQQAYFDARAAGIPSKDLIVEATDQVYLLEYSDAQGKPIMLTERSMWRLKGGKRGTLGTMRMR